MDPTLHLIGNSLLVMICFDPWICQKSLPYPLAIQYANCLLVVTGIFSLTITHLDDTWQRRAWMKRGLSNDLMLDIFYQKLHTIGFQLRNYYWKNTSKVARALSITIRSIFSFVVLWSTFSAEKLIVGFRFDLYDSFRHSSEHWHKEDNLWKQIPLVIMSHLFWSGVIT